ncbi:retrotransposon protein, putative, ty1-copia subclass, partial [Tanacetum coccineum]
MANMNREASGDGAGGARAGGAGAGSARAGGDGADGDGAGGAGAGGAGAGGDRASGAGAGGVGADGAGAGGAGAGGAGADGAGPAAPEITGYTYIPFIKCDPQPFKGTKGAVGLCQWFEKLESVFRISDCKERDKVKFATATLQGRALTWWNGRIASMGIDAANGTPWTKDKGFRHEFMVNGAISVSKDNICYFNAFPRDGIFEIDMHNHISNEHSIYTCSNKKSKHNLNSTFLWHYRLSHINKKRIEKLQHDGLLESIDNESFDVCVSCISGKMARNPFTHASERADDLLGIIHSEGYALESAARILNMVPTKK